MTLRQRLMRLRMRRRIRLVKRTLSYIDRRLARAGMPSWKRQQVRRDIITSDKAWVDFVGLLDGGNS